MLPLLLACTPRHVPEVPLAVPQAAELLEAHLAAIGGAEALRAHRTRLTTGTVFVDAQGIAAPFTVAQAAPAEVFASTQFPGGLLLESGVSDGVAWGRDPGARYRYGEERVAAMRRGSLHRAADYAEGLAAMAVLERADFHGVDAWRCAATTWRMTGRSRCAARSSWARREASWRSSRARCFREPSSPTSPIATGAASPSSAAARTSASPGPVARHGWQP